MRVVPKLTLAILAGTCAILAVNGFLRVRREVALFDSAAVRDHRLLGRTLGTSVRATWQGQGETDALALIDEANEAHGKIHFRWVWLDPASSLHADGNGVDALERGETVTRVDEDEGNAARHTYVPVTISDGRRGALELSESLDDQRAYVRRTILDSFLTTLSLLAMCGLLAFALGNWLVGRPVSRIVEKARRIGDGDFSPMVADRRDELGDLARAINAMCARIVTTNEQLRHADRLTTVGKLASGIAHELGTPLNVISGRAQMIATGDVIDEEALSSARIIHQAADRMAGIIRQLLDFARRRTAQKAPYDLSRVAKQTVDLVRTIADKRGVELVCEATNVVEADVDPGQLQQAVANIVVNAIQASPKDSKVVISVDHVGTNATIAVADHGGGIAADHLNRVFEPFFTTKEVGEGTGLGLSVAWGIVKDHGGSIDVESQQGQGTTFTITVPACHDGAQ